MSDQIHLKLQFPTKMTFLTNQWFHSVVIRVSEYKRCFEISPQQYRNIGNISKLLDDFNCTLLELHR